MTTNELATDEGLHSLKNSIIKNIADVATPTNVNSLASCTFNLK